MPREHCHKTDTFLPEPTAASHPCSAEKRKNKCPATPRRRDRRRTGRGPEDTPCMDEPPPFRRRRSTASRGRRTRRTDCGTCTGRHGLTAGVPRPLRPGTKAPFRPDTFLQPLPGRAAPADDPQPGPAGHDPRPEETADRFPGKTSGHPRRKKRKKRAPTEKAPGGLRKKPRTIRAEKRSLPPSPSADVSGDGNRGMRGE